MKGLMANPDYWRLRAEEARLTAHTLSNDEARRILLGIAGGYDRMDDQVMLQSADPDPV